MYTTQATKLGYIYIDKKSKYNNYKNITYITQQLKNKIRNTII